MVRSVCHLHYCHAVLLAGSAEITTWLPNDDVRKMHLPVPAECSVGYWLHGITSSGGLTTGNVAVPNFLENGKQYNIKLTGCIAL